MGLIKCKSCGHEISKNASSCPNCGEPKKKKTGCFPWFMLFVFVFFGLTMFIGQRSFNQPEKGSVPISPKLVVYKWQYNEYDDDMGRGKIKSASVKSKNTISFKFPYNGVQRATLHLRNHPKHGNDVILTVEKGQFMCSYDGCSVEIRFDDGKVSRYNASESSTKSTDVLFIKNYNAFVANAKKSKNISITAPFYKEGNVFMEFNSEGLNF